MKLIKITSMVILSIASISNAANANYASIFKNKEGCFLLYDLNNKRIVNKYSTNPQRCAKRIAVDSTFKVPLSLMAFDQKIITESTVFIWDGKDKGLDAWNRNQTPKSWEQNSTIWVSQEITPKLGMSKIKSYLKKFNYGNQDFSGDPGKNNGLTHAWLSSSLKASANEQLEFLKKMFTYKLPVSKYSVDITKENIYLDIQQLGSVEWRLYGKTGSGWVGGQDNNNVGVGLGTLSEGWFIGAIQRGKKEYLFVTNFTDTTPETSPDKKVGGPVAKEMTIQILRQIQPK